MNSRNEIATHKVGLKRVYWKLLLNISMSSFIPSSMRYKLIKRAGVKVQGKSFFGNNVTIDTIRPDLITIGSNCVITKGTSILSHFYDAKLDEFYYGNVTIGNHCFIGMNTLIVKPVTIGDRAVIAAGSVITKNIPEGEIWGGVPAKFISKR